MWIFCALFPRESQRIFPNGNIPHISHKMSKCHTKGPSYEKNIPVMLQCYFFGELKGLHVWGNFSLISTRNFGRNLGDVSAWKFPNDFSTAYNRLSMLINHLFCHPAKFTGGTGKCEGFGTYTAHCGYTIPVNVSPIFPPSPSPCARSSPYL